MYDPQILYYNYGVVDSLLVWFIMSVPTNIQMLYIY